jgi:hypothetical protein
MLVFIDSRGQVDLSIGEPGTMIHLHFATAEFDYETEEWHETTRADLVADGQDIEVTGPNADWIDLDLAVLDPNTGEVIHRPDGAERWARLLPSAFRSGDVSVEVVEDSAQAVEDRHLVSAVAGALMHRLPFGR